MIKTNYAKKLCELSEFTQQTYQKMKIEIITDHKKRFLDLLLLADEQESMIDRYLERGELFALYDVNLKSIAVVTHESSGIYELKNLATYKKYQNQGYGRKLVEYISHFYSSKGTTLWVGTGNVASTIRFYEKCGFVFSHTIPNFFIDHYDHPIFENEVQLVDMVYLKKEL